MNKPLKTITNPMTLIAIFATLSETSAAISLPFLDDQDREYYLWFLISFPFYLLLLFFITLNFNYRSLYSPSDFRKSKHFIKTMDDSPCRRKRQLRRAEDVKELLVIRLHRRRHEPDSLCIVCSQSKRRIETCRSRHLKQASIVVCVIYSKAGLATHGQDE
ncbi:hypothetical protein [Pseudomonas brassicacearum]|uniref:hypothetical protein n=1 Tax=Pseudomonas brassicacearum TaxID=930166 RepID=UPI0034662E4A